MAAPILAIVALGALALGPFGRATPGPERAEAVGKRPNVIVVMTDDQTVDDLRRMTRTRDLVARRGTRFRNSYVSYPLCCPSRATFFTGQYAHNHGVMGLWPPTGGYGRLDKRNALPVWMQGAGYHTAHIGKFLNGYGSDTPADVPPGWSEWFGSVDPTTYRMWGYTLNENGKRKTYGSPFDEDPDLYQTDVFRDKAVDFIERRAGRRKPFFLSVSFLAPHHEEASIRARTGRTVRPAPRHAGKLSGVPMPRPRSFDEPDISDKPAFLRRRAPRLGTADTDRIAANYRSRQESLMSVDEAVDAIVAALRRKRVLRRTYVVFTSDNGFMQGEHRVRAGKMLPYEPSSAVPLLISGPGIPTGGASSELVANVDLAPTLLAVARTRAGKPVDGRSLLPFARDPRARSKRLLLHETGGLKPGERAQDGGPVPGLRRIMSYRAVRTPRFLYVRYRNGSRELYDLVRDPDQLHSHHSGPRYARTRAALNRELNRLSRCRGAACRMPGGPIPGPSRR